MNIDNHGFVMQPKKYLMWSAELTGDTNNGILHQLEEQHIVIEWESPLTVTSYSKEQRLHDNFQ